MVTVRRHRDGQARKRGFTLVELLVTLFIFSLIAAAATGALGFTLNNRGILEDRSEQLGGFQTARALLRTDFDLMVQQQPFGTPPPLVIGADAFNRNDGPNAVIITFLRHGWTNPGGVETRGSLQRVAYEARDGRLVRKVWARPDPVADTPVFEQDILTGLTELRIEMFDGGQWLEVWPNRNLPNLTGSVLPVAIAVEADMAGFGAIRQEFLTSKGRR